ASRMLMLVRLGPSASSRSRKARLFRRDAETRHARRVRYPKIPLASWNTMARLHEYQGKAILATNGFTIPRGRAVSTADNAVEVAKELLTAGKKGGEVVIKIQAWTTGRAGIGGVAFAKRPAAVRGHAARMLAMKVGQF